MGDFAIKELDDGTSRVLPWEVKKKRNKSITRDRGRHSHPNLRSRNLNKDYRHHSNLHTPAANKFGVLISIVNPETSAGTEGVVRLSKRHLRYTFPKPIGFIRG